VAQESPRGPHRQELLYALRCSQETDTAIWNAAPALNKPVQSAEPLSARHWPVVAPAASASMAPMPLSGVPAGLQPDLSRPAMLPPEAALPTIRIEPTHAERLPELIGFAPCMLEVSRRIRLVAPRSTPVLIEGPTGSGKELVAEAIHRLSSRSRKPFVAINCAAIPEALLEAELFGHTRGAFTGAVQGRVGRIEAANGGTLFLDEIGEMPLSLQSKLLRFVECGELQRVGDNETVKVDVRIVTATHQPLAQQTQNGGFRADLYYRLAVFLIRTPSLADHGEDLPLLVNHFIARMGRDAPLKRLDPSALAKLAMHDWPGNVRELEHVLERAAILAGDEAVLTAQEIDFGVEIN
jgi:DNA-binding NtrC family response regulator